MDTPEIDPTLRKPRQLRGSPANRFSALVCIGFLGVASALGLIYNFIPYNRKFARGLVEGKYGADSQEQVEFGEHMRVQLSLPAIGVAPHRAKALREASEKIPPP